MKTQIQLPASKLTKKQVKTYGPKIYSENGSRYAITATVRYDDQCGNGHNSFSITADIRENHREYMGGCCHEEVAKHFPELAPFIKWHLTSSDGPMHYVANTLYHASDKDCWGFRKGEVKSWDLVCRFDAVPITHKISESLRSFIVEGENFEIEEHAHTRDPKTYSPNYTLKGYFKGDRKDWYGCQWHDKKEAEEFCEALNTCRISIDSVPASYGEGSEPNLEAARSCAVWPEATLEQLQDGEALEARIPAMIDDFKTDMEALGFEY